MSIIISQQITATGVKEYTKVIRTFDSNITPQIGHKIKDTAFGDMLYYDVEDIMIDFATDEYWVILPAILLHTDDVEDIRDAVREYRSHGWECTKPL